ncbi:MAG TPA: hypothetical protein VJV77_03990, partial [Casimicrobiaceae bacterium]|nr:hypothetical protein [Casimicrobiaceae bacterium]
MNDELPRDDNQVITERRAKLAALRASGSAYPNDFRRDALAADLHAAHGSRENAELEPAAIRVAVAMLELGRVMARPEVVRERDAGGAQLLQLGAPLGDQLVLVVHRQP